MPLKVLHITSNGNIGGREKMLFQLVNLENKDDAIEPAVFFKYPEGPFCSKISALGVDVKSDVSFRIASNIIRSFETYDILVFHFVDWFLFLCAVLSGRPILYRLSGVYLLTTKKYRDVFKIFIQALSKKIRRKNSEKIASQGLSQNKTMPNSRSVYRIIKRYYFSMFLRYFCDKVVVNSRYTASSANRYYGVPFSKIKVIYNGVDILPKKHEHSLFRREFKFRDNDFLIGTVCRFDLRKRIDRLLEGFLSLQQDDQFKMIIVGGGDQNLENKFKQFVRDHGIADRVFFTGFREDVDQIVSALDLFVLPSDNEAFGVAVIEAMFLEKPVIVFNDSGGPVEIIGSDHEIGFIIDHPDEIAQIAMRLRQNPQFGKHIGNRAAKIVTEKFSISRFQQEFKKIYLNYWND
ncbi:glycosyltransferase family 4 protein [bacterium]|nr:glycosyltransferase family 4 protein [bacterium]